MGNVKTRNLLDSFEIEGRWYLPGKDVDVNGLVGTLKYSSDEILLHVQGSFTEYDTFSDDATSERITIFGFSNDGDHFSLFGCSLSNARQSYPGFSSCTYYVSKFYGGDFIIEDETQLKQLEASFSFLNLDSWLRYQVMTYTFSKDRKNVQLQIDMDSNHIDKKSYFVQSLEINLSEEIGYSIQHPQDWFLEETTKVSFHRNYHIAKNEKQATSYLSLFEFMQSYRRLLALLIGSPMFFSYIEFEIPNEEIKFESTDRIHYHKVRLFYRQVGDIVNAKHLNPRRPQSILIRHADVTEHFNEIINKWYQLKDVFQDIAASFISDSYLPGYLENSFLNCAKGLEAYHRYFMIKGSSCRNNGSDNIIENDRQKIIDYIVKNVLPANQDYFLSRVKYEEESSFRARLTELLEALPENLKTKLFGTLNSKEKRKFVSQVVETRNYYTHRANKSNYKNVVSDIRPLMKIVHQMSWMLQYYCITELGVESSVIEKRLCEKWVYQD